ncbi:MAG TPA: hypothetical protein PLL30_10430 [Candidatus Krumholzibacteria bacterium]|nr:hypothetical protein [Candidatus Krumholzibacteria bacterium]HPD72178.1 hypothetical protein [Candidatus Krumholzibacteria bacterium]HRY40890.1 hypothetical protein [Candidatus Krumholzibacteria bacterium]
MARPARDWLGIVLLTLASLESTPALAQIHHADEVPWYAAADTASRRGASFSYDQFRDPDTHWRADRVGLCFLLPFGERGAFFVKEDYWRFDTAGFAALERWPHAREIDLEDPEAVDPDWPGETMIAGFGRPELGLVAPLRLPLLGRGDLGLLVGLPIGRDELYPMSASCLAARVDWRRPIDLVADLQGALRIGWEGTSAANGEQLASSAYPDGPRFGVELGSRLAARRGLTVAWSARELAGGPHSRRLQITGWLPVAGGHAVQLQVARELGGKADRYAVWIVGLGWRLAGLPRDLEPSAASRRQFASSPLDSTSR